MRNLVLISATILAVAGCEDTSDLRSLPAGPVPANLRGIDTSFSLNAELPAIINFCATFVDQKRATSDLAKAGYEFSQSKYSYSYSLFHGQYNKTIKAPTIKVKASSSRPTSWDCEMTLSGHDEATGARIVERFERAMTSRGWVPVSGSRGQYTKNGRTAEIGGRFKVSGSNSDVKVWIRDWN